MVHWLFTVLALGIGFICGLVTGSLAIIRTLIAAGQEPLLRNLGILKEK
jgi:hypothetical protein